MSFSICLQNILHPGNSYPQEEKVYFHKSDDSKYLDLDGYFNLFYIEKHKKYTYIQSLSVKLKLRGFEDVILMHDRDEIATFSIGDPSKDTEQVYEFPYNKYDSGVFWVRLKRTVGASEGLNQGGETVSCFNGFFLGEVEKKQPAKILIDICTYKREKYVARNMEHLTDFLDNPGNSEYIDALEVAIIDNGRTLDTYDNLTTIIDKHKCITVYPNPNTGGAGGFTRGMKEALAQKDEKGFTHVLLMDDDAFFDTEMFVRLFGILWTNREEYKDITIGGALWREDYPYLQFASGEWFGHFAAINEMKNLDLRSYEKCTMTGMCTTEFEQQRYSGWWCCCYSLNVVSEDNLPLSVFVHRDDIEYEVRLRKQGNRIVFLNGIGVWHKAFDSEFLKGKKYYDVRNTLIYSEIHEPEAVDWFMNSKLRKLMSGTLFFNRYLELYLTYEGVMDYLKGRDWLFSIDPELNHKRIAEITKKHTKYITLDELPKYGCGNVYEKVKDYIENGSSVEEILSNRDQDSRSMTLKEKLTLNGQLLPAKKGAVMITPQNSNSVGGYRYKKYLFVERGNPNILYVKTNYGEVLNMVRMYLKIKSKYSSVNHVLH
ncbi:MAG: glycosyltransferase family 2 protein [Butyrivibrio sp.]|nr:glycosyltransferase family 2 protein [Butyrivibrio sp.]